MRRPDHIDAITWAMLAGAVAFGAWLAPHLMTAIAFLNYIFGGL